MITKTKTKQNKESEQFYVVLNSLKKDKQVDIFSNVEIRIQRLV